MTKPITHAAHDVVAQEGIFRVRLQETNATAAYVAMRAAMTEIRNTEGSIASARPPETSTIDDSNDIYPNARYNE